MNSMTGFGSATHRDRGLDIGVEVRSVNHRFISLKQGLPEPLSRRERDIEALVRSRLGRGSVTLTVSLKSRQPQGPALPDLKVLKATWKRLDGARKALGLKEAPELEDLLSVPGLWSQPSDGSSDGAHWPRVEKLVEEALDGLVASREREGRTIERDLNGRLDLIEDRVARIGGRTPVVIEAYQKRLDERIQAVLAQKGIEGSVPDIAREIALYADRCDVSEEIQRLGAHVAEFRKILKAKGQVGRRLDFLSQEMVREINTIASKGNDSVVSSCAVEIKAEIEKIKEQVENIE